MTTKKSKFIILHLNINFLEISKKERKSKKLDKNEENLKLAEEGLIFNFYKKN